jgi:hypothetical protein
MLKDILLKIARPELSKIHKYMDAHKQESCYIFGDGVSLKWFDLDEFSDKISISGGLIPFHKSFNVLDTRYLLLAEPFWFYPEFWTKYVTKSTSMPYIQKAYRQVIKKYADKQFFLNLSNTPVIHSNNINYIFKDFCDERLTEDFITRRINAFHGSLRTAITLAIYMGFKQCYLVGCDYTHSPSRIRHWYEKGEGEFNVHENYNYDYFEMAQKYMIITTITLDGSSDCLNSITYENFTGKKPKYRENTELVDKKYLEILDTWRGYNIY